MKALRVSVLFGLLLGFWLLLSGRFDPLFLGMGVVSAAASTWFGTRLLERTVGSPARHPRIHLFWLMILLGWMLGRMTVGAMQVAHVVIDPRYPPRPGVTQFRTQLRGPAARTMLAIAITLVPGTITLEVDGDLFTVHSFTPEAVDDLADARMQNRIAAAFRDADQPAPELRWEVGQTPRDNDPEAQDEFARSDGDAAMGGPA